VHDLYAGNKLRQKFGESLPKMLVKVFVVGFEYAEVDSKSSLYVFSCIGYLDA
jgi:hypothetical protein